MEKFKHILKKIFFLPPPATVLISLPSFIFVFCVLGMRIEGVAAYVAYGMSAYAMVITITGFTRIIQAVRNGIGNHPIMKKLSEHPLGSRYLTDVAFRTKLSLYQGFITGQRGLFHFPFIICCLLLCGFCCFAMLIKRRSGRT